MGPERRKRIVHLEHCNTVISKGVKSFYMQDQFKILANLTFTSVLIQVSKCAKEMEGTGIESSVQFF